MSIQSEIDRIEQNVADTYSVLAEAGAPMPASMDSDNLAGTAAGIAAVLYNKVQNLTSQQKQQARQNIDVPELEDIVQQVIAEIGTPIVGVVNEQNVIVLSGELADGIYTVKYLKEGDYIEIGELDISGETPAPDTTIIWEKGLKIDSSTGAETTGTSTYSASNYIEIVEGYTYTINKITTRSESVKVCYYNENKTFISTSADVIAQTTDQKSAVIPLINGAAYFRLRLYGTVAKLTDGDFTLTATKN